MLSVGDFRSGILPVCQLPTNFGVVISDFRFSNFPPVSSFSEPSGHPRPGGVPHLSHF